MILALPWYLGLVAAGALVLLAILALRRGMPGQSRELAEADRQFRATFEQAAVGIAHFDSEGRWLRVNARFCEIAGYSCPELRTKSIAEITHPDDIASDSGSRNALLSGLTDRISLEKRYIRKDGRIAWINESRSIVRGSGGRPDFFMSIIEDIKSHKEAEAQVVTGEAQYRAIFDSTTEAMAVIDARGIVQSVSPAVERIFGYAPEDLLGRNIRMLMPKTVASRHDGYLRKYRDSGVRGIIGIGREVIGQRKDGSQFPLDISVAEWKRAGETFFTGIMRDISARKDAEWALRASEESLRLLQNEFAHMARVNDLGEMAAAISHEINQPLTAIVNYLNTGLFVALEGHSEDGFAEAEQMMRRASEQALRAGEIVRRLREFVGKGNGIRTVERAERLVDSAIALALIDARSSGIAVDRQEGAGDAAVEVDAIQIQQVLVNLLRNAVDALSSAPKKRGLRLTVSTCAKADGMVEFAVADNGPGIAPELADRIFEPFMTTKSKGMGMGLSVCRRLLQSHGGTIEAASEPGAGATFKVKLPRYRSIPA